MTYSQIKIDGDFTTYSDSELVEAATLYAVRGDRENHQRVGAERVARAVAPTFADRATVTRAFANVREASEYFDREIAGPGNETRFTGSYVARSVAGRVAIGFEYAIRETGWPLAKGYAYLYGADRILNFVESADQVGDDLTA